MRSQMARAVFMSVVSGAAQSPYFIVGVNRATLVQDALLNFSGKPPSEFKKPLRVKFFGEDGIDAGGVKKEFFQLLIRELFAPQFGMFVSDAHTHTVWFNPVCDDQAQEYRLVGIIIGLAIYNGVILDLHLPTVVYKKLMGKKDEIIIIASCQYIH